MGLPPLWDMAQSIRIDTKRTGKISKTYKKREIKGRKK